MPFSTTQLIASTDMDNMLRGLTHDNSNGSVTGTLAETDLKSFTIPANTIGPNGGLHVVACGTITGVASNKSIRFKFGGSTVLGLFEGAVNSDWFIDAWCFNAGAGAQRWFVSSNTVNLLTSTFDYQTTAVDTTSPVILKITGQVNNVADAITETMFNVFVVQVN